MSKKLVIVAGKLDEGKCGVADYSLLFAGEMEKAGWECMVIGFNDVVKENTKIERSDSLMLLRFSREILINDRIKNLINEIELFNPSVISFQFTPGAFVTGGLNFLFFWKVRKLKKYPIHLMLHEIWTGAYKKYKISDYFFSVIQKFETIRSIAFIKPNIIHTNTSFYKSKLKSVEARLLPVFSNIPVNSDRKAFIELNPNNFNIVIFGTFSGDIPGFYQQLLYLFNGVSEILPELKFHIVGRGGPFKIQSLDLLQTFFYPSQIIEWGELRSELVSSILLQSKLGISRAPIELAGKSGSSMAMLEHGMPILLKPSKSFSEYIPEELLPFASQLIVPGRPGVKFNDKLVFKSHKSYSLTLLKETLESFV